MALMAYKDVYPELGEDVFVAPGAWVIGDVVIGARTSVWFNSVVRGDDNYIRIGADSNVQDNCTLHVTIHRFPLEIGDRVTIGHNAIIHGSVIEDDCLIGMGSVIMDGVRIGKGSIVAGGAVVPPGLQVPPGSMVMGVPGKVARQLTDADHELIQESWAHYVRMAGDYLSAGLLDVSKKVKGFLG
ncbi:MAG: gamma carbonic anhydrase family protein [Syntrophobacteraceae bacterium]